MHVYVHKYVYIHLHSSIQGGKLSETQVNTVQTYTVSSKQWVEIYDWFYNRKLRQVFVFSACQSIQKKSGAVAFYMLWHKL